MKPRSQADFGTAPWAMSCMIPISPDVDPMNGKADPAVDLGGKPEYLAADGMGKIFMNLADKNKVAVIDSKAMKVINVWPSDPGKTPTGMSMDDNGHLFIG